MASRLAGRADPVVARVGLGTWVCGKVLEAQGRTIAASLFCRTAMVGASALIRRGEAQKQEYRRYRGRE